MSIEKAKDKGAKSDREHLVVSKIRNGTVIDHISPGMSPLVLKILGIGPGSKEAVSMAMNVHSSKMGKKDILKVEGKFIGDEELNRIALIAPEATINLVEDFEITRKFKVRPPAVVENIIKCPNQHCISNSSEPISSRFRIFTGERKVVAKCDYCGKKLYNLQDYI
jgi:aspartate carbamoyltransferase regulatory subunit